MTIHANPRYRDREAIAPYNFVSLPEKPSIATDPLKLDSFAEGYTGEFDCVLHTETPIYIRGMLAPTEFGNGADSKNKAQFFSLDDGKTPRIPGSSLRGLFRHMVAIAANARMNNVTGNGLVYRAVDTTKLGLEYRLRVMDEERERYFLPRVKGGYVRYKNGDWFIQPAEQINGTTWCRISHRSIPAELGEWPPENIKQSFDAQNATASKNGKAIYIQPGAFEYQEVRGGFLHIKYARALRASEAPGNGLLLAALAPSGTMLSKRSEAIIFAPDAGKTTPAQWLPLNYKNDEGEDIDVDRLYRDQVTDAQRGLLGRDGALRDMQPVFYLLDDKGRVVIFGHTQMLRLPYKHSPLRLVPGELQSEGKDDIDLAEAIFGTVRKDKDRQNKSFAGRVSFSDGHYLSNLADPFERDIKPKVLSGPKPTTFQHYLAQPLPNEKEQLQHYDDRNAQIRGDKLYWHRGRIGIGDVEERDSAKLKHATQYTTIRAVKAGAQFKFTLRFENLRLEELGALAWVLRIAGDPKYRLKLGMGKPHGMGAIGVSSALHLTDRAARYTKLMDDSGQWAQGWQDEAAAGCVFADAITKFERFVAESPEKFAGQLRIVEFLTMLRWDAPDPARTRYMEIERRDKDARKINEYRTRPVLPNPMFVMSPKYVADSAPPPPKTQEEQSIPALPVIDQGIQPKRIEIAVPEVRENVSPEAEKIAKSLASSKRLGEGDIVTATIVRVTANDYECKLQGNEFPARLPRDEAKGLKQNETIRAKVKRITATKVAILTTKGLPKI